MELIHGNNPKIELDALHADARWKLAQSLDTHPGILSRLAYDADVEVRATVASHPALRETDQWTLSADPSALVRAVLARAPGTEVTVLVHLAAVDEDESVLRQIVENRNTPLGALLRLQDRLFT